MRKIHDYLVNYQGYYEVFRKMPIIIFWFIFVACTIAGIAIATDYGEFGEFLGGLF